MTLLKKCVKNSFYQCSCLLKVIASLPQSAWDSALYTGRDNTAAHHVHVHCICTCGSVHTAYTQCQVSRLLHPLSLPTHTHTRRLMVIGGLMPILTHIGYTVDWKQVTVITWGGLRGAVGLALALVVAQTPEIPMGTIGSKV